MAELIKLLSKLIRYFLDDPMRLISLIGGSGGIVYWFDRYKNRTRLRVRLLRLGIDPSEACIVFEAENIGNSPMSLEPLVYLKGIIPTEMRKERGRRLKLSKYSYEIGSPHRSLPPHVPQRFEARCDEVDDMRPYLWFMTYKFTPTRGRPRKIRVRSGVDVRLLYAKYLWELTLYALANRLNMGGY